ncbi:MAG: hypothetical protein AAFQ43_09855 [Bacteroidota bacterium]
MPYSPLSPPSTPMEFDFITYLWCAAGVVVSVLLPILWAYVREKFATPPQPAGLREDLAGAVSSFWEKVVKPYLALAVVALLTSLLVVFVAGDTLENDGMAFLAGYAWQATLEKIRNPSLA